MAAAKVSTARYNKVKKKIEESGYKADYIASEIGCSSETLSRYKIGKEGYVTEGMTSRLEKFFAVKN